MKNSHLLVLFTLAGLGCARPDLEAGGSDGGGGSGGSGDATPWPVATMSHTQALSITASDESGPASGVTATLRRHVTGDRAPVLLWQGQSDDAGNLTGEVALTPDDADLELVLTRPGFQGPYTDASLRTTYGYYAPAAWLYLQPAELASLRVQFERIAP
ncbi:MAG TPA: hypothetical protein VHJ20_03385 [Polyangia bacterium]|nr:hypothetical protein [Polyangia bacterium]